MNETILVDADLEADELPAILKMFDLSIDATGRLSRASQCKNKTNNLSLLGKRQELMWQ